MISTPRSRLRLHERDPPQLPARQQASEMFSPYCSPRCTPDVKENHLDAMPLDAASLEAALAHFCAAHAVALENLQTEVLRWRSGQAQYHRAGASGLAHLAHRAAESCPCPAEPAISSRWTSTVSGDGVMAQEEVQASEEPAGSEGCLILPEDMPEKNYSQGSYSSRPSTSGNESSSKKTKLKFSSAAQQEAEVLRGCLEHIVHSPFFDTGFALLIFCNAIVMAFEAQWKGLKMGAVVPFDDYRDPRWHGAQDAFDILEWIFGSLFALELVMKVLVLRFGFVLSGWNWMDSGVVFAFFLTQFTGDLVSTFWHPLVLRLLRLARLLRLVRLFRSMKSFDSLIIMETAMRGSVSILFWMIVVLTLVLMLCALILQAMCETYVVSEASQEKRDEVFMFYGTFARSLLTMFEITMGNWMPPCRALVENVSEWFMIFFIMHKLVIGFSVLAVMQGVFMQETFKVANHDDHIMLLNKERAAALHTRKMRALFLHLDENKDGAVTLEEFQQVVDDPAVRHWLSAMGLEVRDVESVFRLLDYGDLGKVTAEELVLGVSRLKGQARSIDLAALLLETRKHSETAELMVKKLVTDVQAHFATIIKGERVHWKAMEMNFAALLKEGAEGARERSPRVTAV